MADRDVAHALAEAARTLNSKRSLPEILEEIMRTAQLSLPGVDHVGVSVAHQDGRIDTVAATDDLVRELDRFQYDHGDGPCYFAITEEPVLLSRDLLSERRWPNYVPEALRRGVRAQMGLRLYTEKGTYGGMNLYATTSHEFDEETVETAQLFATHAALALGKARHEEQLTAAIASRQVIGQAVGIIMERYDLNQERAFAYLARASSTSNVKVRTIARELVENLENRKRS